MNEYELIGRLADLDTRLKKLEGVEPIQQPQPAPVRLVEAVSAFLKSWGENDQEGTLRKYVDVMEEALTAEKRRQELWNKERDLLRANVESSTLRWIDGQVDAFDRERGV